MEMFHGEQSFASVLLVLNNGRELIWYFEGGISFQERRNAVLSQKQTLTRRITGLASENHSNSRDG